MRLGPHTAENVATGIATIGAGVAGSSLPGGAAVGGAIQTVGTAIGGHVIGTAATAVAVATPIVVGGAICVGVACLVSEKARNGVGCFFKNIHDRCFK